MKKIWQKSRCWLAFRIYDGYDLIRGNGHWKVMALSSGESRESAGANMSKAHIHMLPRMETNVAKKKTRMYRSASTRLIPKRLSSYLLWSSAKLLEGGDKEWVNIVTWSDIFMLLFRCWPPIETDALCSSLRQLIIFVSDVSMVPCIVIQCVEMCFNQLNQPGNDVTLN